MGMGRTMKQGRIPLPGDSEVGCIACGRSLCLLPDAYPLAFRCDAGHFMTSWDLLEELLPMGRAPQPSTVECWSRTSEVVEGLATCALDCGNRPLASDLEEAAGRIGHWARSLKNLLDADRAASARVEAVPSV